MPTRKRKITSTQRSAFWPCGSCRLNCKSDCILCDSCKQWFHAKCENLSVADLDIQKDASVTYTCNDCFDIVIGTKGNEFKVTQLIRQDNEEAHDSVGSSNVVHSQDEHTQSELSDSIRFDSKIEANEKDPDEFGVSCVNVPEVSYVNLEASNISSSVDEESSINTSEMTENISVLPVPKNVQPLPQDRWHKAEDIYKIIQERNFVHNEVPPGDKSNIYMLVDNKRNEGRFQSNQKCEFYDDCGVWISQKGNTCKSSYYLEGDRLVYCELKNGKYSVKKRSNGKTSWIPLEPQPTDANLVILSKYYATLKENPTFQKHVTFVCKSPDSSLASVALFEYKGKQPTTTSFTRTNPKTVDKIKEKIKHQKPKDIYADLRKDDSLNCARDFQVIRNQKYEQKIKDKIARADRVNIADEILEVLGMVNDHPFVQTIIHNKDQVPNIICYTTQQILDLKHFVKNATNQPIGIDRTFNLGNYFVTTLVYQNQRVIRKHSRVNPEEHPIFLGPIMLHKDATFKTYKSFLEQIKTELDSEIPAVELRLSENIEFGTDDEKALTKAIDHVFPSSTRLLCTKHLKDNVKHYLQNNVGMEKGLRETVMDKIFGAQGITDANCTVDFETKSENLKTFLDEKHQRFEQYFSKHLKDRLQQYVVEPCMVEPTKRNWTNNNAESINNILKLSVDWKPQGVKEMIEKIYKVTELHFLDYRSALHDDGNYRLTKAESSQRVREALWRCKSDDEKKELFLKFLKGTKSRKRKYIESRDGKFSVIAKAQTKATKASQSKRPRNVRTSKR